MPDPAPDKPEEFGIRLRWPGGGDVAQRRDPPLDPAGLESDDASAGQNQPATPRAMSERHETAPGAISALSMRIDALAGATNILRSQLIDRIGEYAEILAGLAHTQATDLDDHRHSAERISAELRRALADREGTLSRLTGRVEQISGDLTALHGSLRSQQAEHRSVLATGENLTRTVTEGLYSFGTRVLDQLDAGTGNVDEGLSLVRAEVEALRRDVAELRRSHFDRGRPVIGEVVSIDDRRAAGGADPRPGSRQPAGPTPRWRRQVAERFSALSELVAGVGDQPHPVPAISDPVPHRSEGLQAALSVAEEPSTEAIGAVVEGVISRRLEAFLAELPPTGAPEAPAGPPLAELVREAIESALPIPAPTPSVDELRAMVEDVLDHRLATFQDGAAAPVAAVHQAMEDLRDELAAGLAPIRDAAVSTPEPAEPAITKDDVAAVVDAAVDRLRIELATITAQRDSPEPPFDRKVIGEEVRAALTNELDPLREELASLDRRLRARTKPSALTDAQLARLADTVAAQLQKGLADLDPAPGKADAVAARVAKVPP